MITTDPADLIDAYGLTNVVYYPQSTVGESVDSRTLSLLSSVGLPHSEVFTSKEDPEDPYEPGFDPLVVGSRFDHYGLSCPEESRTWWVLGYLFTSLIALDPRSGKVYAFPESEEPYILLHRDVESLLFSLIEFRKLEVDHENLPDTVVSPWKPRVWEQTAVEVVKSLADPGQQQAARERLAALGRWWCAF